MHSGPSAPKVELTERQKKILTKYINKRDISTQIQARINIILHAYEAKSNLGISKLLGLNPNTVKKWRNRWVGSYTQLWEFEQAQASNRELLKKMLHILSDQPRSGAPPQISLEEKQKLVALACKKPEEFGIPLTQWNRDMLAKVAKTEGIVKKISPRYVGEILKKK